MAMLVGSEPLFFLSRERGSLRIELTSVSENWKLALEKEERRVLFLWEILDIVEGMRILCLTYIIVPAMASPIVPPRLRMKLEINEKLSVGSFRGKR